MLQFVTLDVHWNLYVSLLFITGCFLRFNSRQSYTPGWVVQYFLWLANWLAKLVECTFKFYFILHFMSHRWPQTASRLTFNPKFNNSTVTLCLTFYSASCITCRQEDEVEMLLTWPVVLKPNSRGQETAKARTQTVAIIIKTLFLERWVVLYKTGITTAVYLQTHSD